MEPLISVIVPIYNVEAYLKRCVNSIQAQTYSNLEIILVDDGSPDGCGALCDELAKEDRRITVIHKENGGLSDARNKGLDAAGGQYIAFVDSDDYIAPYFIRTLYEQLIGTNSDVALCSYAVVTGEEAFPPRPAHTPVTGYSREELLRNLYDANHEDATYFIVAWNKLYRSSLWSEIRFPKGKIHEDEATTYRIFDKCRRGVYVKTPMYGYFTSGSSITRDAFSIRRLEWMDALDDRIAFFREKQEWELVSCSLKARADGAIHYYYPLAALCRKDGGYSAQKKRLKAYVREALMHDRKERKLPLTTRIGYRIFCSSPGLYRLLNRKA
ncbi:MAG: glycosyltransferase family 2 protein [Lachnospiraceae bacterium]|nr:glycosyltransferase family 2 protein [Lachnospiraceae bacterium]